MSTGASALATPSTLVGLLWPSRDDARFAALRAIVLMVGVSLLPSGLQGMLAAAPGLPASSRPSVLAVSLYASVQAVAGCLIYIIWRYSTDRHRFVEPTINPVFVRFLSFRSFIVILLFLASILIAILSPTAAQVSWAVIPFINGFITRHVPGGYQFRGSEGDP